MKLKHSIIFVMMAILLMLPMTAFAADRLLPTVGKGLYMNQIDTVAVTVSGVKAGCKAGDCKLTIPSDANYTAKLGIYGPLTNGFPTMDANATFEVGKEYRLLVIITPNTSYSMASEVTATINGEKAAYTVIGSEPRIDLDVTIENEYSIDRNSSSVVVTRILRDVAYTVEEPVDGVIRKAATNVAGNITGDETATLWYKNDKEHRLSIDDRFEDGNSYIVEIHFNVPSGYTLMAETGKINGHTCTIKESDSGNFAYVMEYQFDNLKKTPLTKVEYKVAEPVDGATRKAATDLTGIITDGETATRWYKNDVDNLMGLTDKFENGNSYLVIINFNMPVGYELATKTGKINGHTCTIRSSALENFGYAMEYQFDNLLKVTEVEEPTIPEVKEPTTLEVEDKTDEKGKDETDSKVEDKTEQEGTGEIKEPKWSNASEWAKPELEKADENKLIPDMLNGKDFTSNITRREFAATCVKLYEKVSGKKGTKASNNPFTDTNDAEVLKAYNLGITNGTSETTFSPDALITREQMATMMTRALNKSGVNTTIDVNAVSNKFADHNEISTWALDGVYFMSARGVIKGVGENRFNVKGNATREQALAISSRSVTEFKK